MHRATSTPSRPQLLPNLPHSVEAKALRRHPSDLSQQHLVSLCAPRSPRRIQASTAVPVVRRRGDRQQLRRSARPRRRVRWSSMNDTITCVGGRAPPGAKYADAFRRISLARRSSRFSRSSSLTRFCSAVVTPGRSPASRSARRTHLRSVSGAHPNFWAIDLIAAHSVSYESRFSRMSRTRTLSYLDRVPLSSFFPLLHPLTLRSLRESRDSSWRTSAGRS